jgi:TPR repeat protein
MEHTAAASTTAQLRTDAASVEVIAFGRSAERSHGRSGRFAIVTALCLGALGLFAVSGARASAPLESARAVAGVPHELQALESACVDGDAAACNDLGVSYERGYSVQPDAQRAAALFERACDGGVADGCSNLGALHERGAGAYSSVQQAFDLYQRACDAGSALGCSNLGALHARGIGTRRDRDQARRLFRLAREGGSATGCENLAATVGR